VTVARGGRRIRVLLVDDHPVVRDGLRSMLLDSGVDVVADAGTGADAVRLVAEAAPDVVLLDMALPDLDGVTAVKRVKEVRAGVAILVLSMHDDPALVRAALQAGARGYLLKGVNRRELLSAVHAVHDGKAVLDPCLVAALTGDALAGPPATASLTPIEEDVVRLIAVGLTNREIAGRLRWSVATVKKYVQRVLAKLEVSDRTQAAVVAVRRGLVSDDR
jgi:DNA-binding NarL/FixJ family response regulator